MKNILFVCTGNTCRSPMAQVIFNSLASQKGIDFTASSAGLNTVSGLPASDNAISVCDELGLSLGDFRSTDISEVDLSGYELICALAAGHKEQLLSFGVEPDRIYTMTASGSDNGIADPYGGGIGVYRICRDEISAAVKELINELCA